MKKERGEREREKKKRDRETEREMFERKYRDKYV